MKPLPDPNLDWPIPLAAVELIAHAEGLCLQAYRCPAGKPTIGWGQTEDVSMGMCWTKAQADEDLCRSIAARCEQVLSVCTRMPSAFELGAMVSLQYNIGQAAFARSTVLKAHNSGDPQSASRAFGLWNKARVNGVLQELRGLTARRAAEAALYLRPVDGSPPLRMPQAVEPQSTMVKSPIVQSGAAAVVAGGVSVAATVKEHLGVVGGVASSARTVIVDTLGIPASALAPMLLVIVGAVVIWQRFGQRIKGWC
jgi:GH24 family phage-related lysozyme (muramidase)